MDTQSYIRTQTELLADIQDQVNDTTSARWSEATVYRAINEALMTWYGKVGVAHIYTIVGGWLASTFEYSLPAYVRPPLRAEVQRPLPYNDEVDIATIYTWQPIGSTVESDGDGGLVLRLLASPRGLDGRVKWYAPNSRVPTTSPTTSGSTAADATTTTIGSVIDVDDTGHIKINSEWMAYYGVTRGSTTTVLNNLVRGLYGTTAAVHNTASTVYWGVSVDDMRLYNQLYDQVQAYLYRRLISDGSVHESGRYQGLMQYAQERADVFWRMYAPVRPAPVLTFNRKMNSWT